MYFCSISALNLSIEKGFQGGICGATLLMLSTLEEKGDIEAAFLLAVSLKATHFEVIAIFFYTSIALCKPLYQAASVPYNI